MKLIALPLLALSAGCAAQVYHPSKTRAEMSDDIAACKAQADERHYWDRLAALEVAYGCLEAKGYSRNHPSVRSAVEKPMPVQDQRPKSNQPCRVPCPARS